MLWHQDVAASVSGPQIINDSKTPSGPVHVGALRGVLIHDAVYRALAERGIPAEFRYGIDDYDALDELPPAYREHSQRYLGMPLCNVPAPDESAAPNIAEFYISPFLDVLAELNVSATYYRMSGLYRSGVLDGEIDKILSNAPVVRRVYREVSGSRRADDWFPFHVICERCGRIASTRVYAYDGTEVSYECVDGLVSWSPGCGNKGRISPFGGNGKLPWKLEWVARWNNFPVTIEGAGKDHNTRGGSREVAATCLREIFHREPPINIPYEFFLVGGAKMSSSKGVGVTAREMATLVPPDVLRFLMVRTPPSRPVDFPPVREKIVRLYSDFDRMRAKAATQQPGELDRELLAISQTRPEPHYFTSPFDLVLAMAQLPHIDPVRETERLKGAPLTPLELEHLASRVESARYWLTQYAAPDEKFELTDRLAEVAPRLGVLQREFLHLVAAELASVTWSPEALQALLFDAARLTPLPQSAAFGAVYLVLSGQEWGPRAGNLLAFLDRDFVLARFIAVDRPSRTQVWAESAVDEAVVAEWLGSVAGSVVRVEVRPLICADEPPGGAGSAYRSGVVEALVVLADGRRHVRRCRLTALDGDGPLRPADGAPVEAAATEFAAGVRTRVSAEVVVADVAACEPVPVAAARS